jgi:hypothetical protein
MTETSVAPKLNARDALRLDFENIINKHGRAKESKTPDHVLADYLVNCLFTFEIAVSKRDIFADIPAPSPVVAPVEAPAALVEAPAALVEAPAALVEAPAALVEAVKAKRKDAPLYAVPGGTGTSFPKNPTTGTYYLLQSGKSNIWYLWTGEAWVEKNPLD